VKVRFPLALPGTLGVKVTVNDTDCPAGIVTGSEIPDSTNSLLLLVAEETVTDDPAAVRLPLREEFEPSGIVPKLRLVWESESWAVAVPVPESPMLRFELEAFETIAKLPLAAPEVVGANVAVNVTLWFGVSVAGKVNPLIEKPEPDTLA